MNDPELLTAAMGATKYADCERFAVEVLRVDLDATPRCRSSLQPVSGDPRAICAALIGRPLVAELLAAIHGRLMWYDAANGRSTCDDC